MKGFGCFDCVHGKCSVHGTSFKFKSLKAKSLDTVTPPSFFVGRFNYPNVNVGVLSPVNNFDDVSLLDSPSDWFSRGFSISNVLNLRSELVNFRTKGNVKKLDKFTSKFQEIGLQKKQGLVNFDISKVSGGFKTFKTSAPIGLRAEINDLKLVSTKSSDKRFEKVFYDTDLKSVEAMSYLYIKKKSVYDISKVLSLGMTGVKSSRKLVPTRWSITATDDSICKLLIDQIKDFKVVSTFFAGYSEALGNRFLVIVFPTIFRFELIESMNFNDHITSVTDFEIYSGRKGYASNTAGGYYASRLSVCQELVRKKVQGSILVFREITSDYYASVGVWQVRENVKQAVSDLKSFESLDSVISFFSKNFGFNIVDLIERSKIKYYSTQKSLFDF